MDLIDYASKPSEQGGNIYKIVTIAKKKKDGVVFVIRIRQFYISTI